MMDQNNHYKKQYCLQSTNQLIVMLSVKSHAYSYYVEITIQIQFRILNTCIIFKKITQMSILSTQSFSKLEELNREACLYIDEQRYEEAAECLDEAERILEYAANCGKTIQRTLITTILNNQACLLQKNSLLQQSSNYLQAIINNINDFIENCAPVKISQITVNSSTEQYIKFATCLERKIALALYHLRFCALVSHSQNHELALKSAKKALELLKQICQEQYYFQMYRQRQDQLQLKQKKEDEVYKYISGKTIYKQLSHIKMVDIRTDAFDMYLPKLIQSIQKYHKRIDQNKEFDHNISDIFKSYSIGNLMEAAPLPLPSQINHSLFVNNQFSIVGKLYRIIHISMAYFTVATELRLVAADRYALNDDQRTDSLEFQQSKIYHQISIMLIVKYFPCKSVFFDHAVCSFQNHYGFNLLQISQMHTEVGSVSVSIIHNSEDQKRKQKISSNDNYQNQQMQYKETINIPEQALLQEVEFEGIKNAHIMSSNLVKEGNDKQKIEFKKLKQIKQKDKIQKSQRISSSKPLQVNKITAPAHSKNKENTSKNRLFSKNKNSIKSKSKDMRQMTKNNQKQQKRGIYYETNKNRSRSKKCNVMEKITSKKVLFPNKLGKGTINNKAKQIKIGQEYGIHSTVRFCDKTVNDCQAKNLHNKQQQNYGTIKFNKVTGRDPTALKKLKSPRCIKKQSVHKRKSKSKDHHT